MTRTARSGALGGALLQRTRTPLRLAFAGGGTGGHLVPGLHLLAYLEQALEQALERSPEQVTEQAAETVALEDLLWFTSGRPVEQRILAHLGPLVAGAPVCVQPLPLEPRGGGAPSLPGLTLRLPPSVWRARAALREHRSQVLLGLGGFTTAPAVIAAKSLGIPVALLEINACPGRATRALSRLVRRVFHAWPATAPSGVDGRHRLVGPPVSPAFQPAPDAPGRRRARGELGLARDRSLLLVLGGSQGAAALNAFVRAHLGTLLGRGLCVVHQVGPGRAHEAADPVRGEGGVVYRVVEYARDMPRLLAAAELVLCRGGASTLAEVAAVRVPAWVVPYPHHADRHQERNAAQLGNGVRVVEQSQLGLPLAEELASVAGPGGGHERDAMRRALAERVPRDAAQRIFQELRLIAR